MQSQCNRGRGSFGLSYYNMDGLVTIQQTNALPLLTPLCWKRGSSSLHFGRGAIFMIQTRGREGSPLPEPNRVLMSRVRLLRYTVLVVDIMR